MTKIHFAFGVGLILSTALVQAKDFQGSFVSGNGFDHVEIHKSNLKAFAISGSGNMCDLEGFVKSGLVTVDNQCKFKLIPLRNGGLKIDLPEKSSCNDYCGANVSISGEYEAVPPMCDSKHFEQSLAAYRGKYHQKQYETAYQSFSKTVNTCKPYM